MAGPIFPDTRRPSAGRLALAERVALLETVEFFEGAAKKHLRQIARPARLEQFDTDQELMSEGQPSTTAFVIVAGSAEVRRKGRKVAAVGRGDIVGELGLLLDRPRNATVRSTSPLQCLALDRAALKATVTEYPAFGWHLLQTIAARLSA